MYLGICAAWLANSELLCFNEASMSHSAWKQNRLPVLIRVTKETVGLRSGALISGQLHSSPFTFHPVNLYTWKSIPFPVNV
ncbi:uncharacterized protein BO87DRAFT_107217 [Aspergillus neoniger CBS 115656]|uniref:Uncharacterized protein n=1 Tax=Aspergillus neoniger (strain CBS 115656) TaxID=1448310 RepID=A0A318YE59_ASPNB|nr:hypothetical protein BO87DRAFT_107217 [Aspergillus neoniger CBS 115656]PYH32334.1 hypothetical protein BO87DRAFT_107217 [Aspergillus neoniger CBS 115656]